eukprot:scaffold12619_cov107-Cylindrotheca_fusiformis.AAC.2
MSPMNSYFVDLIKTQGVKDIIIVRDDAVSSDRTHFRLSRKHKDSKFDSFTKLNSLAPCCPLRKESSDDLCETLRKSLQSPRPSSRNNGKSPLDSHYYDVTKKHNSKLGEHPHSPKHSTNTQDNTASPAEDNMKRIHSILSSVTDMLEMEEFRRIELQERHKQHHPSAQCVQR